MQEVTGSTPVFSTKAGKSKVGLPSSLFFFSESLARPRMYSNTLFTLAVRTASFFLTVVDSFWKEHELKLLFIIVIAPHSISFRWPSTEKLYAAACRFD